MSQAAVEAETPTPAPAQSPRLGGRLARWALLLLLLPGLALWELQRNPLVDFDEGIHGAVSLAMVDGGTPGANPFAGLWTEGPEAIGWDQVSLDAWLYPQLGDGPYFRKPPLKLWLSALLIAALPADLDIRWALRLPAAIPGLLAAWLLAFWISRATGRRWQAALAALGLVSLKPLFLHGLRTGEMDGLLMLCFVGVLATWWAWTSPELSRRERRRKVEPEAGAIEQGPRRLRWALLCGGFFGLGAMSKGLAIAPLLPLMVLHLLLLPLRRPRRAELIALMLVFVLLVAPWHLAMHLRYGLAFWEVYFGAEVGSRLVSDIAHLSGDGPWSQLGFWAQLFTPWGALVLPGLVYLLRDATDAEAAPAARSFAGLQLIWLVAGVAMVTSIATRHSWYLHPMFPPALVAAAGLMTRGQALSSCKLAPGLWLAAAFCIGLQLPLAHPEVCDLVLRWFPAAGALCQPLVLGAGLALGMALAWRLLQHLAGGEGAARLAGRALLVVLVGAQLFAHFRQVRRVPEASALEQLVKAEAMAGTPAAARRLASAEELHIFAPAGSFHLREAAWVVRQISPAERDGLAAGELCLVGPRYPLRPDARAAWTEVAAVGPYRLLRRN